MQLFQLCMKASFDKYFDIAHLGQSFWRKLTLEHKSDAFLLCLDDDGHLLDYFSFGNRESYCSSIINACISLGRESSKATTLVRIQSRHSCRVDPFEICSIHTKTLYDVAVRNGLYLAEVVLPEHLHLSTYNPVTVVG